MKEAQYDLDEDRAGFEWACGEEEARAQYAIANKTLANIQALGIREKIRPVMLEDHRTIYADLRTGENFDGRLPSTFRKLTLDELSSLLVLLTNWYSYVRYHTGVWVGKKVEAEKMLVYMKAAIRRQHIKDAYGAKIPDTIANDRTTYDIRFIDADANYETASTTLEMLRAEQSIAHQNVDIVSREITIRQVDASSQRFHASANRKLNRVNRQSNPVGEIEDPRGMGGQNAIPTKVERYKSSGVRDPRAASSSKVHG